MTRRLFNLLTLLSVLVFFAGAALWGIDSPRWLSRQSTRLEGTRVYSRSYRVAVSRGRITMTSEVSSIDWGRQAPVPIRSTYGGAGVTEWSAGRGERVWFPNLAWQKFLGFGVTRRGAAESGIMFPCAAVVALAAVLPSLWLIRVCRRLLRTGAGLCPACGYDLRATSGRCPECGAVSPNEAPSDPPTPSPLPARGPR